MSTGPKIYFVIESSLSNQHYGKHLLCNQLQIEKELHDLEKLKCRFLEIQEAEWCGAQNHSYEPQNIFADTDNSQIILDSQLFPSWFRNVYIENILEDYRSNVLLHLEVMTYLVVKCGYTIEWSTTDYKTSTTASLKLTYEEVLSLENPRPLEKRLDQHESLTTFEMASLKKFNFDKRWIDHTTNLATRKKIWDTFLSSQFDAAIESVLQYKFLPSPAAVFYQVMFEIQKRDCNKSSTSSLDFNLFNERLFYARKVCEFLHIKHSQDVNAEITEDSVNRMLQTYPISDLSVYSLWPKEKCGKNDSKPIQQLRHFFRCWSGMKLCRMKKSHKKNQQVNLHLVPNFMVFADFISTEKSSPEKFTVIIENN